MAYAREQKMESRDPGADEVRETQHSPTGARMRRSPQHCPRACDITQLRLRARALRLAGGKKILLGAAEAERSPTTMPCWWEQRSAKPSEKTI